MKNLLLILCATFLLFTTQVNAQKGGGYNPPEHPVTLSLSDMDVNIIGNQISIWYTVVGPPGTSGTTVITGGGIVRLMKDVAAGESVGVTFNASPNDVYDGNPNLPYDPTTQYPYHFECTVYNADGEDTDGCDVPIEVGDED